MNGGILAPGSQISTLVPITMQGHGAHAGSGGHTTEVNGVPTIIHTLSNQPINISVLNIPMTTGSEIGTVNSLSETDH